MGINQRADLVWPATWLMWKWFGLAIKVKPMYYSGVLWQQTWASFVAIIFILTDVAYNVTIGSFIFWERPRQLLFTDRLEDHKYYYISNSRAVNGNENSKRLAIKYCKLLGKYDPGHCS